MQIFFLPNFQQRASSKSIYFLKFPDFTTDWIYYKHLTLLLGRWYEIMALYYIKSILTEISASRQDRRVLQKSKIIRIEFLSKWGMLQSSRYV